MMSLHQTSPTVEGASGRWARRRGADICLAGAPALVVRPRDPDEVTAALAHAAQHDLEVSIRSGGHSPLGHGTNTGGMVIDLTHFGQVEVLDAGGSSFASAVAQPGAGSPPRWIRMDGPSPPATPPTSEWAA